MAEDLPDSDELRKQLDAKGKMTYWPYEGPLGFDKDTVRRYCVDTSYPEVKAWQKVRLSMKGVSTHEKLEILFNWWTINVSADGKIKYATYVQVYNYLGAIRRGGQLNDRNGIRKYI